MTEFVENFDENHPLKNWAFLLGRKPKTSNGKEWITVMGNTNCR